MVFFKLHSESTLHHKKAFVLLPVLCVLLSSCIKEADFSGFIRSTDRVEERFQQSMAWNQSHSYKNIVCPSDDYKLLITADVHIGGPKTHQNLLSFVNRAKLPDIAAAVYVGDLATGRESDITLFQSLLPSDSITPNFVMVGNHELYFDGWKAFYNLFGSSTYYFTITTPNKKDLFICLDSGGGTHGESQLAWLKEMLEKLRSQYDRCIVFSHSNLFRTHHTASTSPTMDELFVLLDIFETYKVDMVITGHDHKRDIKQLGNIQYIVLDALRDDAKNASYMLLHKNHTGLYFQFIKP